VALSSSCCVAGQFCRGHTALSCPLLSPCNAPLETRQFTLCALAMTFCRKGEDLRWALCLCPPLLNFSVCDLKYLALKSVLQPLSVLLLSPNHSLLLGRGPAAALPVQPPSPLRVPSPGLLWPSLHCCLISHSLGDVGRGSTCC